jgi:hypothetical protein
MNARLQYIVEMVVAIYFVAYLVPSAVNALIGNGTVFTNSGLNSIITVFLPILIILGLALLLMPPEIKEYIH